MKAQPQNDETVIAANEHGLWQTKTDTLNSAHASGLDQVAGVADGKLIATLMARATLAGAELVRMDADEDGSSLILTRGPRTERFHANAIDELERAIAALEAR